MHGKKPQVRPPHVIPTYLPTYLSYLSPSPFKSHLPTYLPIGLRFWARSRVDSGSASSSYEVSSKSLINRSKFLLELACAIEDDIPAICEAMVDAVIEMAEG